MTHHASPKTRSKEALQAEAEARSDLRATFGSPHGKRVLARLHAAAGTNAPRFRPATGGGPFDPLEAAFRDGQAEIVNAIQRTLDTPEDEEPKRPGAARA